MRQCEAAGPGRQPGQPGVRAAGTRRVALLHNAARFVRPGGGRGDFPQVAAAGRGGRRPPPLTLAMSCCTLSALACAAPAALRLTSTCAVARVLLAACGPMRARRGGAGARAGPRATRDGALREAHPGGTPSGGAGPQRARRGALDPLDRAQPCGRVDMGCQLPARRLHRTPRGIAVPTVSVHPRQAQVPTCGLSHAQHGSGTHVCTRRLSETLLLGVSGRTAAK